MKKILLVTLDFLPESGGVAEYYLSLCEYLSGLEQDKIVVLTEMDKKQKTINNKQDFDFNFKIYRKNLLAKLIWPKWLLMIYYIWRVARKEKIEMLWVGEILPTGTAIYLLAKILNIPYIVSCHGTDILTARKNKRKEKIAGMVLRGARYVTANSQYTAGLVKSMGVDENRIKVIYPGVIQNSNVKTQNCDSKIKTKEELIKKYNLAGKKVLLSIGRLVERKGFDNVIRALPMVWKEIPELVYVIGGEGKDKERLLGISKANFEFLIFNFEKNLNCKIQISNFNVIFLGNVSGEDKWAWYDLCDVFISPGREVNGDVEGLGIVFLEAASRGKPVVAGKVGGASEAVIDEETGILVDGESVEEIAGAIIKLFKDKELRERLGRQGKERVEREFQWERIAEEFRDKII